MYKKFTQTAIDDVKDKILSGDFNYYYGGEGSDLDDDYYRQDTEYDDDDDEYYDGDIDEDDSDDITVDDLDVEDYGKITRIYKEYYLVETTDKKYNILDSEEMVMLFDNDMQYIQKLNSGLVIVGNIYLDRNSVIDFKLRQPNFIFDLESRTYPLGRDWFVVNRISSRALLLSNGEKFILFDTRTKNIVTREYDSIQKIINDVYFSVAKTEENSKSYDFIDLDKNYTLVLNDSFPIKRVKGIRISAESEYIVEDDDGNSYQIKLDEDKNYIINRL